MINLMPPQERKELAAARTNTLLLRYTILLGVFIALIVVEIGLVFVAISSDKIRNEATITENDARTVEYEPTKRQAEEFRTNLSTAKYILDKQVPYTTLILAIANGLPDGAVLNDLILDAKTFGTASSLTVKTVSYQKAIEIKSALQNTKVNNKSLFSSVSFNSISSSDTQETYPFTAIYTVTYSKEVLAK